MTRDDDTDPDGVLTPDDLDLDSEKVMELEEDRYVIETGDDDDGRSDGRQRPPPSASTPERGTGSPPPAEHSPSPPDLGAVPETYAIDLTVKTERGVDSFQHRSNDVREQFEALLRWYAGRLDAERPPEEVLQVLFEATDLP